MNTGKTTIMDSPKSSANIISRLFFLWLIKLFYKGTKRKLKISDLYKPTPSDESELLGNKLERNWLQEVERTRTKCTKPSLLKAISNTFFWNYMVLGFLQFLQFGILMPFQPVMLSLIIRLFSERPESDEYHFFYLYLYGGILILLTVLVVFLNHHVSFELGRIGMRVRVSCSSLIYRKVLKLSKKSLAQTPSGRIVNILSNDVQRFDIVSTVLNFLWIMPIQATIITYLIWEQVQISALTGVVAMILMTIPVQACMAKACSTLRLKVANSTDFRVKLMNEIISGIQVIKMYAWEKPFEQIVKLSRSREIKILTYTSYIRGIYSSFSVFTERTTLYFSIISYYLLSNEITADKVFSMAQFFNILQLSMAIFFPLAVAMGAETLISIKRLESILMLDEKVESNILHTPNKGIVLKGVQAAWSPETVTLQNLELKIPIGSLCAVVGPVGAGKSTLLQLLLGELDPDFGIVQVGGNVAYAAQEPWLFVGTVHQNILFGQEYATDKYRKVIDVCALQKDFNLFPYGDKTLVGERGVSLSGGQRARINLARAMYRDADIYLLDDPLSAVDPHVAKHLFEDCVLNYLHGKTRILVTHQLQFLKKADFIVVLNEGKVEAQGTFAELSKSKLDFTHLLSTADGANEGDKQMQFVRTRSISVNSKQSTSSVNLRPEEQEECNEETVLSQGRNAYIEYLKAGANYGILFVFLFLLVLSQVITSTSDYWLTHWTNSEVEATTQSDYFNLHIYTALIAGCIIFTTMRSIIFYKLCMRASQNLHNKMFHALLKAPMRFFDTNPSGRVLNRFSRDMGVIDEVLPRVTLDAVQILLVMCGILVMITIANYYMVVAAILLGLLFLKIRTWYVASAKVIKHLEGISKSPMFSHLSETLNGILTIRANTSETILRSEFDSLQNVHTSAWYLTLACFSAFGLWLDIICVIFVGCVTFSFIIMSQYSEVNGSYVGLAISQSLVLTGMLQFGMRQTAEVVSQMTCVERVLEYTKLEKENTEENKSINAIFHNWPKSGKIEFRHLYLTYSHTEPPVLYNLSFTIESRQKVGIVGRTGAGKSSIISALFRLAPIQGEILIDGVVTATLDLGDLRRNISIIPQEPVLFSASLKFNLDPFNEFEDEALWNALDDVELKESVSCLDYKIEEGGSNLSVGQRQLICLARAILRNNKILILDEATANVDHRTDSLIQATIRKKFSHCTVLTIAHRLNTIMDSDMVLVMDSGSVIEYDRPYKLLQNSQGLFYKMVEQTGVTMFAQLLEIAKKTYFNSAPEHINAESKVY